MTWLRCGALLLLTTARLAVVPASACAQSDDLARGVAAMDAHDPATARHFLELAARRDATSYEANWRLAVTLVDLGKVTPDDVKSPARDSLYALAESYARRAVAAKSDGADGHFALALAVGRASLTKSSRERVKRATEIRAEALRAIALDPKHDGAWHVLGRWNAEIERLSGLERFFARSFLGATVFSEASWDEAEKDLRTAVQLAPDKITHHFDLATVLIDREKWIEAKEQLDVIAKLPAVDPLDPSYKKQAAALGAKMAEKLRR